MSVCVRVYSCMSVCICQCLRTCACTHTYQRTTSTVIPKMMSTLPSMPRESLSLSLLPHPHPHPAAALGSQMQ